MKVKNFVLIGAVVLLVLGCVIAAGCTTQSGDSQKEFVIGSWTLQNGAAAGLIDGTVVVFKEDFTGTMTAGEKVFQFTWKKTDDGKYHVTREDGAQVMWTPDTASKTMVNPAGVILKKN